MVFPKRPSHHSPFTSNVPFIYPQRIGHRSNQPIDEEDGCENDCDIQLHRAHH